MNLETSWSWSTAVRWKQAAAALTCRKSRQCPDSSSFSSSQDCMEEINLFSENKTHLKQLGEQIITASNKTKETEVNQKLSDVNDRWQHLFHHIEAR